MTDTHLNQFVEAVVSGDKARAQELANDMTRQEREQVDQLHAVVQMARIQRARGLVQ